MDMPEPLADWEKEMMLGSQRVVSVSYMGTTHTFPVDSEAPEGEETLNFLEYSEIDEVYLPEGETPEPDYTAYREAQPESGEQDDTPEYPLAIPTTPTRAEAHFASGGRVLVSVNGEPHITVTPGTVTHSYRTTTWEELAEIVRSYGDSRQEYYMVIE